MHVQQRRPFIIPLVHFSANDDFMEMDSKGLFLSSKKKGNRVLLFRSPHNVKGVSRRRATTAKNKQGQNSVMHIEIKLLFCRAKPIDFSLLIPVTILLSSLLVLLLLKGPPTTSVFRVQCSNFRTSLT